MAHPTEAMPSPVAAASTRSARIRPLANRNFRLLWMGENVSLFGDQFYFIALPWLVFQMTGSALAFGTILMVTGIPRAVFMLVGGAMTDRLSPRSVMIVSNLLRLIMTILLTLIVAVHAVELWMLYVIAFCFGLVDAFFHPAYRSIIPLIVDEHDLQASNSLMQGAAQLVQIIGPGVAGVVVRNVGVALSFACDAVTFLFTSLLLWMMRPIAILRNPAGLETTPKHAGGILTEIGCVSSLILVCSLWLLTGFGAGFGSLNLITLTQKRVARPMMGRFMSLMALTEVGLTPISNALAGLLADWNVTALFVLAGALLTVTALLAAMNGNLRSSEV